MQFFSVPAFCTLKKAQRRTMSVGFFFLLKTKGLRQRQRSVEKAYFLNRLTTSASTVLNHLLFRWISEIFIPSTLSWFCQACIITSTMKKVNNTERVGWGIKDEKWARVTFSRRYSAKKLCLLLTRYAKHSEKGQVFRKLPENPHFHGVISQIKRGVVSGLLLRRNTRTRLLWHLADRSQIGFCIMHEWEAQQKRNNQCFYPSRSNYFSPTSTAVLCCIRPVSAALYCTSHKA